MTKVYRFNNIFVTFFLRPCVSGRISAPKAPQTPWWKKSERVRHVMMDVSFLPRMERCLNCRIYGGLCERSKQAYAKDDLICLHGARLNWHTTLFISARNFD
jgi:hypothetical protein